MWFWFTFYLHMLYMRAYIHLSLEFVIFFPYTFACIRYDKCAISVRPAFTSAARALLSQIIFTGSITARRSVPKEVDCDSLKFIAFYWMRLTISVPVRQAWSSINIYICSMEQIDILVFFFGLCGILFFFLFLVEGRWYWIVVCNFLFNCI